MKTKPIIGISPSQSDGKITMRANYAEAILDAGGIPVFLPYTGDRKRIADYAGMLDGLLFAGGVDIHPKYYGESIMFDSVEVNSERDEFEFLLFEAYIGTEKPIFGICRGIQFINVALGGSLYQHIEGHHQTDGTSAFNRKVEVSAGSRLYKITGQTELMTNSYHHQAVKAVPDGVIVTAKAEDGTVECIEKPDHPFLLAVQWHPEMFYKNDSAAGRLFEAFVTAADRKSRQ